MNRKPRTGRRLPDNFVMYTIMMLVIVLLGQVLGSALVGLPAGIIAGLRASALGLDPSTVSTNDLLPAWGIAAMNYGVSIGIWLVAALVLFLGSGNLYMFGEMSRKKKGNTPKMLLFGLALGFAMNGVCVLAAALCGNIHLTYMGANPLALLFVFVCIFIQSSAEEVVCRVYLYQKLLHRYHKPVIAVAGNAVLFGLLHVFNASVSVLGVLNCMLCGIFFSLLVYYCDSVWCAFAAHTAWNYTQNILFGLPNSGRNFYFSIFWLDGSESSSLMYDAGFGVEGALPATLVLVLGCVLLYLWGNKRKPLTGEQEPAAAPAQAETLPAEEPAEAPADAVQAQPAAELPAQGENDD